MKNITKKKGDNNIIIQGIKKSKVNIKDNRTEPKSTYIFGWVGFLIAIIGLIATIIIGWDSIIKFFTK